MQNQQEMDDRTEHVVRQHAPQPKLQGKISEEIYGPLWAKKLIAQLIYYNLNRWQIRNEAAHSSESAEQYEKIRDRFKSTITAL